VSGSTPDADTLAVGLELGRYSRADVTDWVSEAVLRYEKLPAALLELTAVAHREMGEIVALLRQLSTCDADRWRIALAMITDDWRSGACGLETTVDRLVGAAHLYRSLEETSKSQIAVYVLQDQLELAESGTFGTLDDVRAHLEAFLAQYALREPGGAPSAHTQPGDRRTPRSMSARRGTSARRASRGSSRPR